MAKKKIQTVCGYSCSDCDHHGNECPGCGKTRGRPFWTAYVNTDACPIYTCCTNEKNFPHCGKCPELVCERFTRFRDPDMSDAESAECLAAMERELMARK